MKLILKSLLISSSILLNTGLSAFAQNTLTEGTEIDADNKPINQTAENLTGSIQIRGAENPELRESPISQSTDRETPCLFKDDKGLYSADLAISVIGNPDILELHPAEEFSYEIRSKKYNILLVPMKPIHTYEEFPKGKEKKEAYVTVSQETYQSAGAEDIPLPDFVIHTQFYYPPILKLLGDTEVVATLYHFHKSDSGKVLDKDEAELDCEKCKSCGTGVCPTEGVGSVRIGLNIGTLYNGRTSAELEFYCQTVSNPGMAQLRLKAPLETQHTLTADKTSYQTITGTSYYTSIQNTPLPGDNKAFTVTLSTDHSNPSGSIVKTYVIQNITEDGVLKLQFTENDLALNKTWVSKWHSFTNTDGEVVWVLVGDNGKTKKEHLKKISTPEVSIELIKHYEKTEAGVFQLVRIIEETYQHNISGWKLTKSRVDPVDLESTGENLTTIKTYYAYGEQSNGLGSKAGYGKIKSIINLDGSVINYEYGLLENVVKRPFKGVLDADVTTTKFGQTLDEPFTTTREINGELISKVVKTPQGFNLTVETFTNGNDKLTSSVELMPTGAIFAGMSKKSVSADGTISLRSYTVVNGIQTTISKSGAPNANGTDIVAGTVTTSTSNIYGSTISSQTTDAESGLTISSMLNTSFDEYGRALATTYFPGETYSYSTSRTYGCCGMTSETDRNGIKTVYALDDLRRTVKTTRLGVTMETVYNGLTSSQHRYPENNLAELPTSSATAANEISRSVRNLSGTYNESWGRTAKDGTLIKMSSSQTTYKPADNTALSMRQVTTLAKTASEASAPTSTTETYLDGSTYQSFGALQPHMRYDYGVNAIGKTSSVSYVDGTNLKETRSSQSDLAGRTISSTIGTATSTQQYNNIGQLIKTTDADGVISLFEYNTEGQRTTTIQDLNGNGTKDLATDSISHSDSSYTTRDGFTVARSISSLIKPGEATFTELSRSESSINGTHSWSTQFPGTANELTTSSVMTYTGNGNATARSNAANGAYSIQTVIAGLPSKSESFSSDNASIMSVTTAYDTLNRPITQTHSRTGAVTTTYQSDVLDTVTTSTDAGNRTTTVSYDLRGRQLSVDAPDTLDKDGNTLANITTTSYLSNGRRGEQSGAQTYRKTYAYDYALRQHTLTTYQSEAANATGQTTTWNYDATYGRLLNKRDADNKGCDYTYTLAGRLQTKTLARGIITTYAYDTAGRNTLTTHSGFTQSVLTSYDRLSRPTKVDQGAGTNLHEFIYNTTTLVQLSEKITYGANTATPFVRTINRTQDNLLRPAGYTLNDGTTAETTTTYGYDTAGRLKTVNNYTYDYLANSGNIIETITSPVHKVTNSYETNRNGLIAKQNSKLDSTAIAGINYSMNALGQRTSITKNGQAYATPQAETIGYDAKGQVVKTDTAGNTALNRLYTFDGIGNRLTDNLNTYTISSVNEITAVTTGATVVNTVHDDDGNMTTGTLPEDTAGATLVWDAKNRLTKITKSNGEIIDYSYDYQSRRITKTTAGITTAYIYNGWNPIAEYNNASLTKINLWGQDISGGIQSAGGVGGLLAVIEGNTTNFPIYDGNGNITDYLDTAGSVVAHYQYDAFGNITAKTGIKADDFTHRFSTKQRDTETGLYYYGYRYYDPVTGRWPSRDPIEESGGVNLYAFVGNRPIYRFDRLGLYPGSEGHGDQIGPKASSDLISQIQNQADNQINTFINLIPNNNWKRKIGEASNIFRLLSYLKKIGTSEGNKFVYTCKYGWIDHGHFLNNALLTYVSAIGWNMLAEHQVTNGVIPQNPFSINDLADAGVLTAEIASFLNEVGQTIMGSDSAWTREDLISNDLGRQMGRKMVSTDFLLIGLSRKFNGQIRPAALFNISAHWNSLLISSGAVKYGSGVKVLGKTPEEWFKAEFDAVAAAGSGPKAYTINGALKDYRNTLMHKCLCDGDKPRLEAHTYTGE